MTANEQTSTGIRHKKRESVELAFFYFVFKAEKVSAFQDVIAHIRGVGHDAVCAYRLQVAHVVLLVYGPVLHGE